MLVDLYKNNNSTARTTRKEVKGPIKTNLQAPNEMPAGFQ